MMPWVECIQKYPGVYTLLANKVYQEEFLDQYELELKKQHKLKPLLWKGLDVDWSDLWDYAKKNNLTVNQISEQLQWTGNAYFPKGMHTEILMTMCGIVMSDA
jgi:hypothetical protein